MVIAAQRMMQKNDGLNAGSVSVESLTLDCRVMRIDKVERGRKAGPIFSLKLETLGQTEADTWRGSIVLTEEQAEALGITEASERSEVSYTTDAGVAFEKANVQLRYDNGQAAPLQGKLRNVPKHSVERLTLTISK